MEKLKIGLNTALFNAGLIGFLKIVERGNISHRINGDEIEVDAKQLAEADLAQLYIDETIEKFKKSTRTFRALQEIERLLSLKDIQDEEAKGKFFNSCKDIYAAYTQASIKTGLSTLEELGISIQLISLSEKLNKADDILQAKDILKAIYDDLKKPRVLETMYMKNIMYNKIRMLWDGISFLNRQEAKQDVKSSFEKAFVAPLKAMITSEKKAKRGCSNCDIAYDDLKSFSFLNDIGLDTARKKSAFWNYNPDLMVCPLCRFIFSCTPLGFNQIGQDLIFINNNEDIESLTEANAKMRFEEEAESNYRYKIICNLILDEVEVKEKEISNIEVLIRHNENEKQFYTLDIIDKEMIKTIKRCEEHIHSLKESRERIRDRNINVGEEALNNLLYRHSLWNLIFMLLKSDKADNRTYFAIKQLLYIQIKRKEANSMKYRLNCVNALWNIGYSLKQYFEGDSANKNKLKSALIKMQNALRAEDRDLFFDLLIRLYSGINRPIPDSFMEIFDSDEAFKEIGTAFILGALGEKSVEKQKENADNL